MFRIFKKLIVALRRNPKADEMIAASMVLGVNTQYLQSEFIMDKKIQLPSFYVRIDYIED